MQPSRLLPLLRSFSVASTVMSFGTVIVGFTLLNSSAPIEHGVARGAPRWSVAGQPLTPAPIAGLPGFRECTAVEPPSLANDSCNSGSLLASVPTPQLFSESRLFTLLVAFPTQLPEPWFSATIVLVRSRVLTFSRPPPWLNAIVELKISVVPALTSANERPSESVESFMVAFAFVATDRPMPLLPAIVESSTIRVPRSFRPEPIQLLPAWDDLHVLERHRDSFVDDEQLRGNAVRWTELPSACRFSLNSADRGTSTRGT